MLKKTEKLLKLIKDAKNILVTSHIEPDYDAASSVLAIYWILKTLKKQDVTMVLEDDHPLRNDFIEGSDLIEKRDLDKDLHKYDLIFLLDANTKSRFSRNKLDFNRNQKIVKIDHHATRTDIKTTLDFAFPEEPSTCEIIFEIFNDSVDFSATIAKALLTGIVDDTKNFSIRGVEKFTLHAAYTLIERGANVAEISEFIKQYDRSILDAVKEILNNLNLVCEIRD